MSGFTTDFQIIPASAILTGAIVPPVINPALSILPGRFSISADTAILIAKLAPTQLPLAA